ncbi:MAG: chemotaxis protein CheW [Planctomycetaceae bacterium]|jgi:purine-binding chemotaxis protein CheW|uniref:Chemotaxis protein CheW n=1 Tax=Lacipirellula limnantheis TaxID=2528024 RepID=A0A517TTC2_9BACT|nr:chemotaxis protein CheW [Lacipirellula limnantheis]MBL9164831.1 chemotaxis protein CheW [Planctomycetaceae bacterium]QDT71625.1 Chemotaxis protein CheW [Lacipirellula limnantheis]
MTATLAPDRTATAVERQFATFYVGHMLLGVDIRIVQEINRQNEITQVPHAPDYVRGVINLRGDVATVVDLRTILGLPKSDSDRQSRNLIVHHQGEAIGLLVDRISDILTLRGDEITPPPTNVDGVDGRLMSGVCTLESEIVVLLDIDAVLADGARQE